MKVIYEDNHIIVVNKESGEIVQGDKTGDTPLSDTVKEYIRVKYNKPGNVFLGVVHRLDRPVSGLVVFARTSKALSRLCDMFRKGEVHKTYWAVVANRPPADEGTLENWLVRNERQNKSYAYNHEVKDSKKAILKYRVIGRSERLACGGESPHWASSSDKMPVGCYGMSYQGRLEIWRATKQSRRQHFANVA